MKFNNIKNIVEDNIEVYKDNTGYKIEGVKAWPRVFKKRIY